MITHNNLSFASITTYLLILLASPLACQAQLPPGLQDILGKGLLMARVEDNQHKFLQIAAAATEVRVKLISTVPDNLVLSFDEPVQDLSRLVFVPVNPDEPESNIMYIRVGAATQYEYYCLTGQNNRVNGPFLEQIPVDAADTDTLPACQFEVTHTDIPSDLTLKNSIGINLRSVLTGQFLRRNLIENDDVFGRGQVFFQANGNSGDNLSEQFQVVEENSIIVDLGVLEQFIESTGGAVTIRQKQSDKFLRMNDKSPEIGFFESRKSQFSVWIVERISRLSNKIRLRNPAVRDRYACIRTQSGTEMVSSFGNPLTSGVCDFEVFIVSPSEIALRAKRSDTSRPDNFLENTRKDIAGGNRNILTPTASDFEAALLVVESGFAFNPSFEVLKVDFGDFANQVQFRPSEAKVIVLENDARVAQQQVVNLSQSKTVAVETTVTRSFAVETSVSFSADFLFGSAEASLTLSFAGENSKTTSSEQTITIDYTNTFTIPPCTKSSILITTAEPSTQSIPFIATIRKTNTDGSTEIISIPGQHSGVITDQTRVVVSNSPLDSCEPGFSDARRALWG